MDLRFIIRTLSGFEGERVRKSHPTDPERRTLILRAALEIIAPDGALDIDAIRCDSLNAAHVSTHPFRNDGDIECQAASFRLGSEYAFDICWFLGVVKKRLRNELQLAWGIDRRADDNRG
ncbi:hypothetical protein MB46_07105 [Arthrobacter alpinus]|nr:hypothetical protein MB46_07105 [Arthrobacter alpinus]